MRMRWVLWKNSGSLPVGSKSDECDNKETKIIRAREKREKRARGGVGNACKDAKVFFFVHI